MSNIRIDENDNNIVSQNLKVLEENVRDRDILVESLIKVDSIVRKKYLTNIGSYNVVPLNKLNFQIPIQEIKVTDYVRFYKLNKIVYDNTENIQLKLSSVYTSLYNINTSIITIIENQNRKINFYIGVKNFDGHLLKDSGAVLESVMKGIFLGTDINLIDNDNKELLNLISNISKEDNNVSVCSSISSVKDNHIDANKNFTQSIEKLIESVKGNYTIVIISAPVTSNELWAMKSSYENIYTQLTPFETSNLNYSISESESVNKTITESISHSISNSTSNTKTKSKNTTFSTGKTFGNSHSEGTTTSTFKSTTNTQTHTKSTMESIFKSTNKTEKLKAAASAAVGGVTSALGMSISIFGRFAPIPAAPILAPIIGSVIVGAGNAASAAIGPNDTVSEGSSIGSQESVSQSFSETIGDSIANSISNSVFSSTNLGISRGYGTSISNTQTHGETDSKSKSEAKGETQEHGSSKSIQISYKNKIISNILKEIDIQLMRLKESEDLGVWNSCTYFITEDIKTNRMVSNVYQSLIRGKDSSIESCAINLWKNEYGRNNTYNDNNRKKILNYISKMTHPVFDIGDNFDFPNFSPAVTVSSMELAIQAGLPQKSVAGLPVIKYTPFAREIVSYDNIDESNTINIGKIFHFGKEENTEVNLNLQSLASHTFITGSTGSGKSNTIYNMILKLIRKNIKFMVIEPAKGEYKNVFGNRKDVHVFGTNPYYTDLLRINPFSFHESIHILEHIDRLIDIFNVCWPMYAAMPAILKEAMEKAYVLSGWDLDLSVNSYDKKMYPSFIDVLYCLRNIIDSSDFSEEVKSNYTGALVTRIKSLTNGITGRIFSSNEISNEELFDSNVIIDLSRIGSLETKSMIMGILIMKLSEYRSSSSDMNNELKHVTVLEEAHNILKRTSTEQVSESANLLGKSVEMISNSIAEMRTYGEGFIIADQSPSAVDMSTIRNTNTKIILRLPEYSDREMVGKAAGLNDDKIEELAKLHTGVAAVYQNNWVESVLCNINYYSYEKKYVYNKRDDGFFKNKNNVNNLLEYVAKKSLNEKIDLNKEDILSFVNLANIPSNVKFKMINIINKEDIDKMKLSNIAYHIVNGNEILAKAKKAYSLENWNNIIKSNVFYEESEMNKLYINEILNLVLSEAVRLNNIDNQIYNNWIEKFYKRDVL